jgi:pyrroline-5-carboxylate reductase
MRQNMILGILGAGNMGSAIAKGYADFLARSGGDGGVLVYDPDTEKADAVTASGGIEKADSEESLVKDSDAVVLAIKPQIFEDVIPRVADANVDANAGASASGKVFISIAAGISISWLSSALGDGVSVVRAMPNTPAMAGEGMTALARMESVTDAEFRSVEEVFGAIGRTVEVSEDKMDAVTGISGSSPAYAYMYMQALIESGVRNGLDESTSRLLAAQSTLGAARMVLENADVSAEQLRINVCSPGGTTIEAVNVLEKEGFMDTVKRAVYACVEKSKRMAGR